MRRFLLAATIAAGVLLVAAGSAGAVDYPATTGTLTVTAASGSLAHVEGCGFAPGATAQISVDGSPAGTAAASAQGCISTTVTISAGSHTVTATGLNSSGGTLTLSGTFSSSSLAFTGGDALLVGGLAVAMVAVGALFVVVTRRRAGGRATVAD